MLTLFEKRSFKARNPRADFFQSAEGFWMLRYGLYITRVNALSTIQQYPLLLKNTAWKSQGLFYDPEKQGYFLLYQDGRVVKHSDSLSRLRSGSWMLISPLIPVPQMFRTHNMWWDKV